MLRSVLSLLVVDSEGKDGLKRQAAPGPAPAGPWQTVLQQTELIDPPVYSSVHPTATRWQKAEEGRGKGRTRENLENKEKKTVEIEETYGGGRLTGIPESCHFGLEEIPPVTEY
ncbi:unnamed protein product [Lota lota]